MEMEVFFDRSAVDRSVVHTHHVWELLVKQGVEHSDNLLEGNAEIGALGVGHVGDVGEVALREEVDAVRIFGEERQEDGEGIVFEDDALAKILFCRKHIAEQAAALLSTVLLGRGKLQLQLFRDDRIAVDLSVWVRHRGADHAAAVFKDKDVLDILVAADVGVPLCPQVHQLAHMLVAQLCQGGGVSRGVEDDLALAVGRTHLEKVVGNVIRLRRILRQGRKVVVVLEDFIVVRYLARAGTERTPVLGHLWAVLTVGVDHDPVLDQRVPSEFSHYI